MATKEVEVKEHVMGILKGLIISVAGDLGSGKGNEQLKKWVDTNGGQWALRVTKAVTHLICSKEAYKKNVDAGTLIPKSFARPFFGGVPVVAGQLILT